MKILFLTTIMPRKKRMGGEVASQCFIDALIKNGYQVTVLGYMRRDDVFEPNSQEIVVGKRYIETKKAKFYPLLWLTKAMLLGLPYSAGKYYSRAYIKTIKKLLSTQEYDAIVIDHPQIAWLQSYIPRKGQQKLFMVAHNVENQIYTQNSKEARNQLARWIYRRESHLIKKLEDQLAKVAQEVWALTKADAEYFTALKEVKKVRVCSLPPHLEKLDQVSIKTQTKTFDIAIIGSWAWKPNFEGLQWFLETVYPQLPPHLSIHIAGRGAEWLTNKYPNIKYLGFVPNVQEFMAQAKVIAIPILSGGGIQIKTLDAIASGSNIVATTVALRGIPNPPETVNLAQNSQDFANLLVRLTTDNSNSCQQELNAAWHWLSGRQEQFITDLSEALSC